MSQSPAPAPALARRRLPHFQETGLVIVVLLLGLFIWLQADTITRNFFEKTITDASGHSIILPPLEVHENKFLNTNNLLQIVFTQMSWMAVMVLGLTIVIISGGIDISVGSVMGFAALTCASVLQNFSESSNHFLVLLVGIAVPLGVGLACGLINGIIVVALRMHPFIVTLATMSIFRWACQQMAPQGSLPTQDRDLPTAFTNNFIARELPFSRYGGHVVENLHLVPILVMVVCLVLAWVYLRHTVWGRETYAIGGNEQAARYSGIRVALVKIRVYAISGLCAGIAGMLTCGFYKSAVTNTGFGYELMVVAAAVVGGASLTGGRGTALGAVLGMLVVQLIDNATHVLNPHLIFAFPPHFLGSDHPWFQFAVPVESKDTLLINGISIIVAVAIDQFSQHLQKNRRSPAQIP